MKENQGGELISKWRMQFLIVQSEKHSWQGGITDRRTINAKASYGKALDLSEGENGDLFGQRIRTEAEIHIIGGRRDITTQTKNALWTIVRSLDFI